MKKENGLLITKMVSPLKMKTLLARLKRVSVVRMAIAGLLITLLSGCSAVYRGTGDTLINYANDEAIPYLLKSDDFAMACSLSEAFGPFIFSFEQVTKSPDRLKVMLYMMAGQCAQESALNEQLRYLRAVKMNNSLEAKDARIVQKRHFHLAAKRYYQGYQSLTTAFVEPGGQCPKLKSSDEELVWLAGLINGIQALFADMKSGAVIQVPQDIAAKVSRGANCIDSRRWWGVPEALQAAVWATIPGSSPSSEIDPLKMLAQASAEGELRRVRLAHILEAEIYLARGDLARVKEVIRRNAAVRVEKPSDPAMKLLDELAYQHLLLLSDQLWSEAAGHRTPWKEYGRFLDDETEQHGQDDLDISDLL